MVRIFCFVVPRRHTTRRDLGWSGLVIAIVAGRLVSRKTHPRITILPSLF